MITIKEASREFDKVEQYLLTISPAMKSMKDVADGTKITVDGMLTFDDTKENTGDTVEVLSIITPDKEVFSCQSATFKRSIKDIANIMDGQQFTIIKTSGKTKAGRDYIDCQLDIASITPATGKSKK